MTDLYRKYLPQTYSTVFDYIPYAERLKARGFIPYIYDINVSKAISSSTEFVNGSTTELVTVAASSYVKVDVKCTNSKDKSIASGCVRQITSFGIDRYYNYKYVDFSVSGVTAVSTTTTMREMMTVVSKLTGAAGDDAEGAIRLNKTGKASAAVVSITSGMNRMLTSRVYLPKYWRAKVVSGRVTGSTSGTVSSGILVYPHYYDATGAYGSKDEDSTATSVTFFHTKDNIIDENTFPMIYGNDSTIGKLKFYGKRMNALSETWVLKLRVIIWCSKRHHQLTAPQSNKMFLP